MAAALPFGPCPILLDFSVGGLTSLNSIALGSGISYGSITVPIVPLRFTNENIIRTYTDDVSRNFRGNKQFYDDYYSQLPLGSRKYFLGEKFSLNFDVKGISIGLQLPIVKGASMGIQGITAAFRASRQELATYLAKGIAPMLDRALFMGVKNTNFDALQISSAFYSPLLNGMNGHDTYNLRVEDFRGGLGVTLLQFGGGVIASAAINLLFIGRIQPFTAHLDNSPGVLAIISYVTQVLNSSYAWAVVPEAAIGIIPPGVSLNIVGS